MAFEIKSRDLAQEPAIQSVWYDNDIVNLGNGIARIGVVSGCAVTAQGSPDMTVAVAAGQIRIASRLIVPVTAGNLTINAADATNPRVDLISVSDAGVKTYTAGTAAVSPKPPAIPANHVVLAHVFVGATDAAIQTAEISDKRVLIGSPTWSRGTAMPANPATGDRITRTDLDLDFEWDGTRWLSVDLYGVSFPVITTAITGLAATAVCGAIPVPWLGVHSLWLDHVEFSYGLAATNDATHHWSLELNYYTNVGGRVAIVSGNTSAIAASAYGSLAVAVGALANAAATIFEQRAVKVSSPSNLNSAAAILYYRIVGT